MNRIEELETEIENIKEWNVKITRKKDGKIADLERKLKIAEEKLEWIKDINERYLTDDDDDPSNHIDRLIAEAMSAIKEV